jgi:hypothetical protein
MNDSSKARAGTAPCARTRLAESEVASVDLCECGMMHLHLGPFSLRLTPGALRGLLDTLCQALGVSITRSSAAGDARRALGAARRGEA